MTSRETAALLEAAHSSLSAPTPPPPLTGDTSSSDAMEAGGGDLAVRRGGAQGVLPAALVARAPEFAQVFFFRSSATQRVLFLAAGALTGGALPIATMWMPQWYTRLTKTQVAAIEDADYVLVKMALPSGDPKDTGAVTDAKARGSIAATTSITVDDSLPPSKQRFVWEECKLETLVIPSDRTTACWFEFRKSRHYFDAKTREFTRLETELQERLDEVEKRSRGAEPPGATGASLSPSSASAGGACGYTGAKAGELLEVCGPNEINLAPQHWTRVLLRKVLHPFYLFQVASALIWLSESYTTYAVLIMIMSAISIAWEVYSQVSNDRKLHELVKMDASVKVIRDQHVQSINATQLVVGDIVVVEEGIVPADIVMISGECTADESTLTGEAIPITKQLLQPSLPATSGGGSNKLAKDKAATRMINAQLKTTAKESVLFAGSTVLTVKADNSSRGVVLCTGFSTSKGELFRSIIYPRPISFKIERDSYRFMAALSVVAILAFIKRLAQASNSEANVSTGDAIVSSLDLVTIAVPPALPLILTIGVGFALTRLEASGIFCINSQRVNLAGHLDCFCFDKTGTLSTDHLDFQGVDECASGSPVFVGLQSEVDVLSVSAIVGLATCHSLNERNGNITGYALERDMFRATGYSIENNVHKRNTPNAPFSILISSPIGKTFGVVKRYLFDASLQRSSVLIEDFETGQRVVYTKGSPETLRGICNPGTIPANYMEKVRGYSYQGYYVVALASKTFPVTADVPVREAMECRLNFVGFVLFLNKIKTESPYVVSTLEEAGVDVRIITGDNAFTAIHVARKINMELEANVLLMDVVDGDGDGAAVFADVDELATSANPEWTRVDDKTFMALADHNEFALTGAALARLIRAHSGSFVDDVVLHTKIFSRIRPQQKTWIVETLIKRGKVVGMVGDGTNDCGALKAAHVGVALSDADASIVAPFTSRKKLITDVVDLLREGRCALSTSFVAFKYMVVYSIVQVTMSSLMMDSASQMSNSQFLFDDLVVVFGLSVLMVRTSAATSLTRDLPAKTLFAPNIVMSLTGQLMIYFVCLGIAISAARAKSWFCSAADSYELTKQFAGNESAIEAPCYVFVPGEPDDLTQNSYENSVLWLFGHLQYWILALVFNLQDLFRKPLHSNRAFAAYLVVLFFVLQVQLFSYESQTTTQTVGVDTSLGVLELPRSFCTSLFFLFLFDLLLAVVWEVGVIGVVLHRFQHRNDSRLGGRGGHAGTGWKSLFSRGSSHQSGVSPYVAERDSLLGGGVSGEGADAGSKIVDGVGGGDDDDGEEVDVFNQQQSPEIVVVGYNSA